MALFISIYFHHFDNSHNFSKSELKTLEEYYGCKRLVCVSSARMRRSWFKYEVFLFAGVNITGFNCYLLSWLLVLIS